MRRSVLLTGATLAMSLSLTHPGAAAGPAQGAEVDAAQAFPAIDPAAPRAAPAQMAASATPAAGSVRRYAANSEFAAPACMVASFRRGAIRVRTDVRYRSGGWVTNTFTLRRWPNPPVIDGRGTWWRVPRTFAPAFKFKDASVRIVGPDEDERLPRVWRSGWNRLGCPAVKKPAHQNYIGFRDGWTWCAYIGPDKVGLQSVMSATFRPGFGRYKFWIGEAKQRGWATGRLIRYGPPPQMEQHTGPRARLKLNRRSEGLVIRWRTAHQQGQSPALVGVSQDRFEQHCPLD